LSAVTDPPRPAEASPSNGPGVADTLGADPLSPDVVGILDTIDVPIVVVGPDCRLARFNAAAIEAFALGPSHIGQLPSAIAALADAKDLEKLCSQVIADEAPTRRDVQSGDRRFLLRVAPYARGSGQRPGAVLTFTNVTAFRASLEQAVYEREYTKAIINTVSNPLVVLDVKLRVQSANRAFYATFGTSREAAQGVSLRDLGDDDWRASELWKSLTAILADGSDFERLEIERDFPALRARTVLIDARRLSRAGDATLLLSFLDITERKQAETARARLAAIVESSDDAIIGKDRDGTIVSWNHGAERIFGYTSDEVIGRSVYMLIPADRVDAERSILERIGRGERVNPFETLGCRKDGTLLDIWLTVSPIADARGRIVGASRTARDITERKRAESALQDADRRKDEFLALLAHELRNPLAPVRTGLELIRIAGDTPQAVRRVRVIMERQVNQMVRLIDDLLDVSRIASGKIVLQRTPSVLNELVQSAVEAHRNAIDAAKIELAVHLLEQPCVVDVDPTRLVQVLSNVLHNAAKFTPSQGKIRISVETQGPEDERQAVITVSDTGIGISQELLPRIFELFVQAEPATQRAYGGLGIGLALARRLIEMHGGRIDAHSDGPGHGTAVVIKMPVCGADSLPQAPIHIDLPRVASRVVIIDDNQDAAHTMSMLVEKLGGSARMAHDAASGLVTVQAFQPDIVFLDIGMPGTDGYETCRRIRQQRSQRHIVIVAVTGWGQAQDKQRALDAGFDAHLTKPVDPTAVAKVLAAATQRSPA
jgi:PAS domain S-box-containing protein